MKKSLISISLVALAIFSPAANAQPAPTCADLFQPPTAERVVRELIGLRLEIEEKNAGGHRDLARLLYTNFKQIHKDAIEAGVDLEHFEDRLQAARVGELFDSAATEAKVARARGAAFSNVALWTPHDAFKTPRDDASLALSPDAHRLLYATDRHQISLRDLSSKQALLTIATDLTQITQVEANWPEHLVGIADNYRKRFQVYSLRDARKLWESEADVVAFSSSANFVVAHEGNELVLREFSTGRKTGTIKRSWWTNKYVAKLTISADGTRVLTQAPGGSRLYDLSSDANVNLPARSYSGFALASGDPRIAAATPSGQIKIFDPTSDLSTVLLKDFYGTVKDLAFSSDGEKIFATTSAWHLYVWSTRTGELLRKFENKAELSALSLSAAGNGVAYRVRDGEDSLIKIFKAVEP